MAATSSGFGMFVYGDLTSSVKSVKLLGITSLGNQQPRYQLHVD